MSTGDRSVIYRKSSKPKASERQVKSLAHLLTALVGQEVCLELKGDEEVTGLLDHCDKAMNVVLLVDKNTPAFSKSSTSSSSSSGSISATTESDEAELKRQQDFYRSVCISGTAIRYVHISPRTNVLHVLGAQAKAAAKSRASNAPRALENKNKRRRLEDIVLGEQG